MVTPSPSAFSPAAAVAAMLQFASILAPCLPVTEAYYIATCNGVQYADSVATPGDVAAAVDKCAGDSPNGTVEICLPPADTQALDASYIQEMQAYFDTTPATTEVNSPLCEYLDCKLERPAVVAPRGDRQFQPAMPRITTITVETLPTKDGKPTISALDTDIVTTPLSLCAVGSVTQFSSFLADSLTPQSSVRKTSPASLSQINLPQSALPSSCQNPTVPGNRNCCRDYDSDGNELCAQLVNYVKDIAITTNPEWYPGLSDSSSWGAVQFHLSEICDKWPGADGIDVIGVCLPPCTAAGDEELQDEMWHTDPYTGSTDLVFSDEFDSNSLDTSVWAYEEGFMRNNEMQWYQRDTKNAYLKNGYLHIEGHKELSPRRNPNYDPNSWDWWKNREFITYTSASVYTKPSWRYGRMVIRAKVSGVRGSWPAIWTLGENSDMKTQGDESTCEHPSNGEVDIMENYGGDYSMAPWLKPVRPTGHIHANFAWGGTRRWDATLNAKKVQKNLCWARQFHVWELDWDQEGMRILVDGEELNSVSLDDTYNLNVENCPDNGGDDEPCGRCSGKNPFRDWPHFLLLNLALQSKESDSDDNVVEDVRDDEFPIQFLVDYVRIYQTPSQQVPVQPVQQPQQPVQQPQQPTPGDGAPSLRGCTCYNSNSGDVGCCKAWDDPACLAVYVNAATSSGGQTSCNWDGGGDPDYWKKIAEMRAVTGKPVYGMINANGKNGNAPNWDAFANCIEAARGNGLVYNGLYIDWEHADGRCPLPDGGWRAYAARVLGVASPPPTRVAASGHTCQDAWADADPLAVTAVWMCYDGNEFNANTPCVQCDDKVNSAEWFGHRIEYMFKPDQVNVVPDACRAKGFDKYLSHDDEVKSCNSGTPATPVVDYADYNAFDPGNGACCNPELPDMCGNSGICCEDVCIAAFDLCLSACP